MTRGERSPEEALGELVRVVAALRAPTGCPWDRAQNHRTLVPYLLEEAYEAAHAVHEGDPEAMKEELGDLLLQILLHAQIESEEGRFGIAEVAEALTQKLIRRHPHVFGHAQASTAQEVRAQWEDIKENEGKTAEDQDVKPALLAASKHVEVRESRGDPVPLGRYVQVPQRPAAAEKTVAEILLEVVALARFWGCDPELALHRYLAQKKG